MNSTEEGQVIVTEIKLIQEELNEMKRNHTSMILEHYP